MLLKLRDRRRSAPISFFQNEIREGEVTVGVRGIIVPSRVNAGFVEYMRFADEMLQPFLVKGRGGRLSCDLFEGMRQAG